MNFFSTALKRLHNYCSYVVPRSGNNWLILMLNNHSSRTLSLNKIHKDIAYIPISYGCGSGCVFVRPGFKVRWDPDPVFKI